MKKKYLFFVLSLVCVVLSLVVLIGNWNTTQRWRFNLSLMGFIIFGLLFLANVYVFLRGKPK